MERNVMMEVSTAIPLIPIVEPAVLFTSAETVSSILCTESNAIAD